MCVIVLFFFFSSRRRHTRFDCDWSSDVCSSDLRSERHLRRRGLLPSRQPEASDRDAEQQNGRQRKQISNRQNARSEEHTSELQSQSNLVCRLLLEKKKTRSPLASQNTRGDRSTV